MRRLTFILLLISTIFASCSLKEEQYTIDLIVKGRESDFWESVYEGAKAAADIYEIKLHMYAPELEEDYKEQIQYIEDSIARQPDAIILAASEYNLLNDTVQGAIDKDIPIIMIDSDINNENTVAYIGTDNEVLGKALAEELIERVELGGKIGIINFVKNSNPAILREKGFKEEIESFERFTILETQYCFSNASDAERLTMELIKNNPDLVAIAALNKQAAEGAAKAVSSIKNSDIKVYAIDCTPKEAAYMENDIIDFALLQNPYQMGYYAVETAYKHLGGESVEDLYTDIYPVDRTMLFDEIYEQLIFPFEE